MENWIYATLPIILKVTISVLAIFTIIIIITRVSGLRTFAKMSSFDFASTIAVGSILAAVVMNTDQSILKGAVALGAVIAFQTLFSFAKRKFEWFDALFTNKPMLLMKDGEFLKENMKKTNVSLEDLYAKLREANVRDTSEVLAMVMESTGDISVIHTDVKENLASEILTGVRKE